MSYEYEVTLAKGASLDLEKLSLTLRETRRYELLGVGARVLHGAFGSSQRDADWPEDFTISIDGAEKVVGIHGGTESQRQQLLADLREGIAAQGLDCELEEL